MIKRKEKDKKAKPKIYGDPQYEAKDDIYSNAEKLPIEPLEQDFERDEPADDPVAELDVPGSELDNRDEIIGEEDEENNYYSLGGDRHEDLEEDKGD